MKGSKAPKKSLKSLTHCSRPRSSTKINAKNFLQLSVPFWRPKQSCQEGRKTRGDRTKWRKAEKEKFPFTWERCSILSRKLELSRKTRNLLSLCPSDILYGVSVSIIVARKKMHSSVSSRCPDVYFHFDTIFYRYITKSSYFNEKKKFFHSGINPFSLSNGLSEQGRLRY